MKKLKLNLKGAKALNKAEQRLINGGDYSGTKKKQCAKCSGNSDCQSGVCGTSSGYCKYLPCGCKSYSHCL